MSRKVKNLIEDAREAISFDSGSLIGGLADAKEEILAEKEGEELSEQIESKPTVITLTQEELDELISGIEKKHPWFAEKYEDEETCSCCKVDYEEWSEEEISDWRNYEGYRFLNGG